MMERFMNNLDNVSEKLQQLGQKAIGEIGEALENLPEAARAEWEEAKAVWERVKPAAEAHFDRIADALGADDDTEDDDPIGEMEQQVDAQVQQIRAAQCQPNIISEYIAEKYGKKNDDENT